MKCPICYNDFHELSSGMKDLAKKLNRKTDEKCVHNERDFIKIIEKALYLAEHGIVWTGGIGEEMKEILRGK